MQLHAYKQEMTQLVSGYQKRRNKIDLMNWCSHYAY